MRVRRDLLGPGERRPTAHRRPSASADPNAGHKPVTISVGVLRPGATQEAVDALNLQISEFEAKYPWVTVSPRSTTGPPRRSPRRSPAGTLPDVFTIPFTDGKGLIAQHQIVNINDRVQALPYIDKFNPNVLVNGQDADGKIWAVPTQAYGMSLTYNRTLFKAGRPRSRQAADHVGRGPRRRQGDRRRRPAWPATPRWRPRTRAAGS